MKRTFAVALVGLMMFGMMLFGCSNSQDVKSAWVGTWDLYEMSGSDSEMTPEQVEGLKALGTVFTLDLGNDGKCALTIGNNAASGTWEAKSASSASMTINGATTELELADGVLSAPSNGTVMKFKKMDASSASSASVAPESSAAASETSEAPEQTASQSSASSDSVASETAASKSAAAAAAATQSQKQEEATLGSTIEFDDLSIEFGKELGTATLENSFSDLSGATVIQVPVTITNNGSKTQGLNMFAVKEFGPKGSELDRVFTYFDDDARNQGDLRPGASMDAPLYFLYDGDGDYYLTFGFYKTDAEVKIPVSL